MTDRKLTDMREPGRTATVLANQDEDFRAFLRAEPGALLESAPDAMVVIGPDGRILLVNAQTEALFGYGRAELLGMPIETLVPERFRSRHTEHRNAYALEPKTRPMAGGSSSSDSAGTATNLRLKSA